MKSFPKIATASPLKVPLLMLLSGVLLSGCAMDGAEFEDSYAATSVEERYPIKVAEAPVKMNVDARGGALRAEGLNSVIGFAQDARNNASSRITVRYAAGSASARKVAQDAVGVLVEQGVPRSMIGTGSYRGSGSVVTLSFMRKVAVTKECGDWSENMAGDASNGPYPNQGCAMQQNIAAMVANPEDFVQPRPMTPVYGISRSSAVKQYNGGVWTTGADNSQSSASGTGSSGTDSTTAN